MTLSFRSALLHKDLKCKAPLIEPNLRRNLGKW
ncbi:antibiotic acetyltransferase, partial [Acinetobacter lwoffii]|nr:antibiotic acetyltransferase [Acinetobacter lwoffii]